MAQLKSNLPRLALWCASAVGVGITGFFAGAVFVAHYFPTKASFSWGMLSGAVPVGAIAGLNMAQLKKDRRDDIDELRQRISVGQADLSAAICNRDQLKRECQSLNRQIAESQLALTREAQKLAQATKAYESSVFHAKTLETRLEAAMDSLKQWETKSSELTSQIAELEADNQEWEAEFEQRLQHLLLEERDAERASARAEMRAKYEQLIKQFEQRKPEHIRKVAEKKAAQRLEQLEASYEAAIQERDRALENLAAVQAEFATAVSGIKDELDETEYIDRLSEQVEILQKAVEQKDRVILELRSRVVQLEEPRYFARGTKDYRGNKIIDHAKSLGLILDGVGRSRSSDNAKETYFFVSRENLPPKDICTRLLGNPRHLQAELDAIKPIAFDYDPESMNFRATVQVMKERVTRDDINALWLKSSRWESLVKGTCAFRVSANKHGAKSPTVRNILGAKLAIGEKFKLRRYDPSGGSEKDFWRIAPTWRTYEQAVVMAGEIHSLIESRQAAKARDPKASQGFEWVYYVIDELDNTLTNTRHTLMPLGDSEVSEASYLMQAITKATKEGEHVKIGLIVCTQTPNTWELMESKDVNKAFWNNFTQIFIQANAFNYLGSSVNQNKAPKLSTDFTKISDWCNDQNEAIEDEARKYRPALMVTPQKRVIIELPQLGEYGFDKVEAAEDYEFDSFNAYEFTDSTSLDRCLGQLRSRSTVASTSPAPLPHPMTPALENTTVCTPATESAAADMVQREKPRFCPVCGGVLKSRGISDKKATKGQLRLVCTSKKHTKAMGPKTFYKPCTG